MVVCTLGDLLLDVVVRLAQPLARGTDARASTRTGAGGQAANVAAWAAALGAEARFVGKRADDAAGRLVAGELAERHVQVLGPLTAGRTGVVVSLVDADGERTMASDRGVAPELRADEVDERWLEGCDWLHLSGYSLLASPIDGAAGRAAVVARAAGARISVDLASSRAIALAGTGRMRRALARLEPDVVFANDDELEALGPPPPATVLVRKRGARGVVVTGPHGELVLPAAAADVVDSTGAGDAFAAGFLLGADPFDGARRGLEAAARCLAHLGAQP